MTASSAVRRASTVALLALLPLAFFGACRRDGSSSAPPIPTQPPLALDKPRPMPPEVEEAVGKGQTLRGVYEGAFTRYLADSKTEYYHSFRLAEGIQAVYKQSETKPFGPGYAQTTSWDTAILNGQTVTLDYRTFTQGAAYDISQYKGYCERGIVFLRAGQPPIVIGEKQRPSYNWQEYQPLVFELRP